MRVLTAMHKLFGLVAVLLLGAATPARANPPGETPPTGVYDDADAGAYDDAAPTPDRMRERGDRMRDRGDRGDRMRDRGNRGDRAARGERGERMRARIKARFDRDRDGRLSRPEKRAARSAIQRHMLKRLIRRFDRDGDQTLGPGEVPPRLIPRLRKLDRNHDGWLTRDDLRQRRR